MAIKFELSYHCNTHLGLLSRLLRLWLVGGHPLVAGTCQALTRADRHHVDRGRVHLGATDRYRGAVLTSGRVHEGGIVIPIAVDHSGLTGGHYLVGGDGGWGWGGVGHVLQGVASLMVTVGHDWCGCPAVGGRAAAGRGTHGAAGTC
jgi:hypothetical protein